MRFGIPDAASVLPVKPVKPSNDILKRGILLGQVGLTVDELLILYTGWPYGEEVNNVSIHMDAISKQHHNTNDPARLTALKP